jgi:exosome complex component MTR3
MRTGTHSQASGSSYVEMNNTKVFCTVYGPRQTALRQFNEQANLNCTFKYTTFAEGLYKRRRFVAVRTL